MDSFQALCTGCGTLLTRFKSFNKKPFKCFDCKKKRIADNWRRKKQLIHKTIHIPTIEKKEKVV
jgi:hypothetical protein